MQITMLAKLVYANPLDAMKPCIRKYPGRLIIEERKTNSSAALLFHLNINSIQNKFEELKILNNSIRAHILVPSETKVDSSYPNSQFNLPGYHMYRKDRKKGAWRQTESTLLFSSAFQEAGPAKDLQDPRDNCCRSEDKNQLSVSFVNLQATKTEKEGK